MTREAFIQKWLGNPTKQYNEQCRIEMRDDLDKIIARHCVSGAVSGSTPVRVGGMLSAVKQTMI